MTRLLAFLLTLICGLPLYPADFSRHSAVSRPKNATFNPLTDRIVPTIVNGRGLKTSITLLNLDSRSTDVSIFFFASPDGNELPLPIQQLKGESYAGLKGPLPAGSTVVLSTTGMGDTIQQGWALVAPSVTNAQVTALITVTDQMNGRTVSESSYRLASIAEIRFRVPLSPNPESVTGVFLAHVDVPSSPSATVTAVARDASGKALSTKEVTIQPLGSQFLNMSELFAGVAEMAVVDISSTSRAMSAIGVRLSPDSRCHSSTSCRSRRTPRADRQDRRSARQLRAERNARVRAISGETSLWNLPQLGQ